MYDPISVSTALVSSGGDLLIELTDGTIINAGRVRGNPGPQGEKGEQGVRGAHGKDGIDGTNGAKWHTGVGAPELDLGVDGDLYMDVANALLPIYQKVGGNWMFLANVKQPGGGGAGGGGTAAGDGGAIIIYPGPNPPDKDNIGNPIDIGDIWFDPDTGYIWVWDGTNWLPTANKPPVIISPTPPEFNTSSDGTTEYPVMDGDLWLDPDGNILYIYRDGVWSEITGCAGGGGDEYVKRKGDSMYGDLLFKYDEDKDDSEYLLSIRTNNTYNPKQRNFYGDYPEFKLHNSLYLGPKNDQSNSGIEIWATHETSNYSHYLEVSGQELWSASFGGDGNLRSTLTHNLNGDFMFRSDGSSTEGGFYVDVFNQDPNSKISFYTNTSIEFHTFNSDYEVILSEQNGFTYNDNIQADADEYTVTNKKYVDAQDEKLQLEAEVLQREIEAITPTTDKGIWQDGASATPGAGRFAMRLQGGAITQDYTQTGIDTIIISTTDKAGGGHSFLAEEVGDLIQLFDIEDKNYGLFEIEAIDTSSSAEYVSFTVKWLQGIGETHVDDDVLVKTFAPPTGGTASEFLPLVGGTMVGDINYTKADSQPFAGIKIVTGIGDPEVPDHPYGYVFYANIGGQFSEPEVICGVPPTVDSSVVNKKYADGLLDFSQYEELS